MAVQVVREPAHPVEVELLSPEEALPLLDPLEPLDPRDIENLETLPEDAPEQLAEPAMDVLEVREMFPAFEQAPSDLKILTQDALPVLADYALSDQQRSRRPGSTFGFERAAKGDLAGVMYDLKRDGHNRSRQVNYTKDIRSVVDNGFSAKAFRQFHRVPRTLYLTHLFVPYVAATTGPEAFGVGDLMEPTGWVVHYSGSIQPPLAGRYRFVGEFDDILLVCIDGRVVLEVGWGEPATAWRPTEHLAEHACFTGHPLVYGDWVDLRPLQPRRIDILVGENPGGAVGGVLLIQQEGRDYQTAADGRPVLPVFAVQPLTEEEQAALNRFADWPVDARIPVMGVRRDPAPARADSPPEDEVEIVIR